MRAALAFALAIVAGCTATPPDPVAFCVDRETYVCARECTTGRYSPTMCSALCASPAQIEERCAGTTWPPDCAVTDPELMVCLEALRSTDRIATPSHEIGECLVGNLCLD